MTQTMTHIPFEPKRTLQLLFDPESAQEWENFKERIKKLEPSINLATVSEHDFAPGAISRPVPSY